MTGHARIIDVVFEPEHWNPRCGCTIPEGWAAWVEADHGHGYESLPKQIAGSPADLIEMLKRDYRKVTAPRRIHDMVESQ